jgi:hypothetical protein
MQPPRSNRTAHLLRISTTVIFLLLGVSAYLLAATMGAGAARTILQSVGSFLIGTVVVGYAYEYFLSEESENRTIAKLDQILAQRVDDIFPGAAHYGFKGFATEVPRNCFDGLEDGDELLWLDTYSPDLMLFVPQLRAAINRGASVRMLVISPDSPTAKMRATEIADAGYDITRFTDATRDFLGVLENAGRDFSAAPGRLEMRCYEDLPCVPMYLRLHKGRTIAGVTGYFLAEPSFNAVHIRWSEAPGGMLEGFRHYFERKWNQLPSHFDSKAGTTIEQSLAG